LNGTISVFANEYPAEFQQMFTEFKNGNTTTAQEIHQKFVELMNGNFIESNPIPVKTYMQIMGLIPECHFRLPLVHAKPESVQQLESILNSLT
jgi:4-hydroxy-tetrahydrodipicolinate synthase